MSDNKTDNRLQKTFRTTRLNDDEFGGAKTFRTTRLNDDEFGGAKTFRGSSTVEQTTVNR